MLFAASRIPRARLLITVFVFLAAALFAGGVAAQAAHAAVERGIADPTLTQPGERFDEASQTEALSQMGPAQLGARSVRFVVSWAYAMPSRAGVLDESYMAGVDRAVALANQNGLKVMLTFAYVPKWASNRYYWTHNSYTNLKRYDQRFVMKTDKTTLRAFQAFCRTIAQRYQGRVWAYECWNEPNLHITLYPQATKADPLYGAHVYVKMLRRFSAGIHAGDPRALRLAGANSSHGYPATYPLLLREKMTSPQRFAKAIKAARINSLFEGYSHHPWMQGATKNNWPEAAPRDPNTTVALQNLKALLRLFPKKPFYLTEYGYNTAPSNSFTGQYVSLDVQADYLRRAYKYVARYPQVKLLMWFLLDDFSPNGKPTDPTGLYTGLRDVNLNKKPSWYTFAGGNTLTLTGPSSMASGEVVALTGVLASRVGPVEGATLTLESSPESRGPWTTVKTSTPIVTDAQGAYTIQLQPKTALNYRIQWRGVVKSTPPPVFISIE